MLIALFLVLCVRLGGVGLLRVHGESMQPTLQNNDMLIAINSKLVRLKQGDIVVARIRRFDNGKKEDIIKRVIATGGQTIEIRNGQVFVDDKIIEEDYIKEPMFNGEIIEKMTVPDGEVFVMGDNRNNSLDSRIQGTIKLKQILYFVIK